MKGASMDILKVKHGDKELPDEAKACLSGDRTQGKLVM